MIQKHTIDKIVDAAAEDIKSVVEKYGRVSLTKKGAAWVGLCPFHSEKNPSFKVNEAKGFCKCFSCGKGGNAVSFVMEMGGLSFPEALRQLAKDYSIEIDEEEETPEQLRENRIREELFLVTKKVQEWFVSNYSKSEKARDYVKKRWDNDIVDIMGIGYAPDEWPALVEYARNSGINTDRLIDLSLIKKNEERESLYSVFFDRITIPIMNKYGQIEGWTCRDISGKDGATKYMNSYSSPIYDKSKSLFGISHAVSMARRENKMYLVEGASDAMRLFQIGVFNTIAPLGTAVTIEQLNTIKRITKKLCIIPDCDAKKPNEKYTPGTKAAMATGQLAIREGFNVSVKQIPDDESGAKRDPDSYIVSREILRSIEEEDFLVWYAKQVFPSGEQLSTADEREHIVTISSLLALCEDEMMIDMFIAKLAKIKGSVKLWEKSVKQQIDLKNGVRNIASNDGKIEKRALEKFGFFVEDDSYCSYAKDGDGKRYWSNFTLKPMYHIIDAINSRRLFEIKNNKGLTRLVELKTEELVSVSKFRIKIESLGNFIWMTNEHDLIKLKLYLYDVIESATEIKQLGWQNNGFYAFGNGVYENTWIKADDFGIVRLNNELVYLPGSSKIYSAEPLLYQFERKFVHDGLGTISLNDYSSKLIKVFGSNAIIGLSFLFAALFRDIVVKYAKTFPLLNLFGPKGAGKTELGNSLMSFFIVTNQPPNIQNSTVPALAEAVARCSNALVHLDELKNDMDIMKWEFLKGLWDGSGRSRMNMDKDKKVEMTAVNCGVIISGQEMATADIALFSRFIFCCFNQTEYSPEERNRYNELKTIEHKGLTHLTLEILRHREEFAESFLSNYNKAAAELQTAIGIQVEDRVYKNWIVPLAAFRTLRNLISVPFEYQEVLDICAHGVLTQNKECKTNNEISNFWKVVSFLNQDGKLFYQADYRIEYANIMKLEKNVVVESVESRSYICLRMDRIFMLYQMNGKMAGGKTLPESAMKYYLEQSPAYKGTKVCRFKKMNNSGYQETITESTDTGTATQKVSYSSRAMVFDAVKIYEQYGLDLTPSVDDIESDLD